METASPASIAPEAPWPHRGYAWYVVIVMMMAYAFAILDRVGLGLLVQPIEADLHITDSQMGLLQGLAFAIFYSLFGLPIGFLADRLNRRAIVTLGITVWSAATIACGFAGSFLGLGAARIGIGAGEATLNPAGTSMIADYFPPKARSKAYAVYVIGTSIGTGMAFLLGGAAIGLADHLQKEGPSWLSGFAPWNIVFFLIGVPGLLVGLVFALTVREPVRRNRVGLAPKLSLKPLWTLLSNNWLAYSSLMVGGILNYTGIYALLGWFPTLLIRVHGLAPPQVGQILGAFGIPGGILSAITCGWIIAWLEKRGKNDAPILISLIGSIWFAISGVAFSIAPSANLAIFFYFAQSLVTNWAAVSTLTGLNKITPNEMRGQVVAIFTLSTGLLSVTLGSYAPGWLSDHVFGQGTGIGLGMAVVFGISGLVGGTMLASGRAAFRRILQTA